MQQHFFKDFFKEFATTEIGHYFSKPSYTSAKKKPSYTYLLLYKLNVFRKVWNWEAPTERATEVPLYPQNIATVK